MRLLESRKQMPTAIDFTGKRAGRLIGISLRKTILLMFQPVLRHAENTQTELRR